MPMKSKDLMNKREDIRVQMQQALREGNAEGFSAAFEQMMDCVQEAIQGEYEQRIEDLQQEMDARALTARGVRQLTSEEKSYYQKLADAMRSKDPKQAVSNLNEVMPKTVINSVFDDLRTNHPLLSRINFVPTSGAVELIMNADGYQEAAWGPLCAEIVKELTSGFRVVQTNLLKLSAFIPVCKAMLDLGPEWLDRYVREILYEALANGMEAGIVTGDGNNKPIGMNRQVGEGVSVTDGVYPEKEAIQVTDLSAATVGGLIAKIAVTPSGKQRKINNDVLFLVSSVDYYGKVMPATTIQAPDGTYRNDVMPYPMIIIPIPALATGEALIGTASGYFAALGTAKEGRIEYSDDYHFLEDERVYLIKAYGNGMPKDNNAFQKLDISGLKPAAYRVEVVSTEA